MTTNILYIDTETTGLDSRYHGITQLSAIAVIDGDEVGVFDMQINPFDNAAVGMIDEKSLAITGKTRKTIESGVRSRDAIARFADFLERNIPAGQEWQPAGYNVQFDLDFISAAAWRWKIDQRINAVMSHRSIDILAFVRAVTPAMPPLKSGKLADVCAHFDIHLDAHNSMNDIIATRQLYKQLLAMCNLPNQKI